MSIVEPAPRPEEMWGRPECPDVSRWSAPDGVATETEVTALLAALVTALKPGLVIETGSYLGHTSEAIGRALQREARGRLLTFEIAPDRAEHVRRKVYGLPVDVVTGTAQTCNLGGERVDLLFVDSEYDARIEEIRFFRRWASKRCVVVAHDSVVVDYKRKLADLHGLEGIVQPWLHLPTPRGLSVTRYTP